MPKADWGIDSGVIDDFDRDSQFTPYAGPTPPDGVYRFTIKTVKFAAGTKRKLAQLRPGLELNPRGAEEKKYKGYFIMGFLPVGEQTAFRYVPFLDAIGVTGTDFAKRTVIDEDQNIVKIGKWRNNGETDILAQIRTGTDQDGNPRKEIAWMGAYDPDEEDLTDDDEGDDYEEEDED